MKRGYSLSIGNGVSGCGVILDSDVDADLPAVLFDRVQIQQVLVNLMRNAVEAMETVSGSRKLSLRAHGGRLWAEANADGGSTFAFTLPIQAPGTA